MGCYKRTYQPVMNVQRVRGGKASRGENVEWVWLSVDPHHFNYPNWTPYHYVVNNPVNIIDPDGRDTAFADNQARQDYMTARNNVTDRIADVDSRLENASGRKANRLQSEKDDLMKLKSDFDRVEDPNTPLVEYSSDVSGLGERQIGNTDRGSDGTFKVKIRKGHDEAVVHENRHVNQILDLGNDFEYNINMELDAYQYQQIYNPSSVRSFIENSGKFQYRSQWEYRKSSYKLIDAIKYQYPHLKKSHYETLICIFDHHFYAWYKK